MTGPRNKLSDTVDGAVTDDLASTGRGSGEGPSGSETDANGGVDEQGDDDTDESDDDDDLEVSAADVKAMRRALKKANREAATNRRKLRELEQEEERRRKAEMTELERAETERQEAQERADRLHRELTEMRHRQIVERAAASIGFHDPSDAWMLADRSDIDTDEDGWQEGLVESVKALAKSKPHLLKTSRDATVPDAPTTSTGRQIRDEDRKERVDMHRRQLRSNF